MSQKPYPVSINFYSNPNPETFSQIDIINSLANQATIQLEDAQRNGFVQLARVAQRQLNWIEYQRTKLLRQSDHVQD